MDTQVYELDKDIEDPRWTRKKLQRREEIMGVINSQPLEEDALLDKGSKGTAVELNQGKEGALLGKNLQLGVVKVAKEGSKK